MSCGTHRVVHAGNVTFLGALLLGSATLTLQPPPGTANSTAVQLVTSAVSAARLSPQTRQEAFAQAILQGLQVQAESIIAPSSVPIILSINANAILAAAAFSTQSMNAVAEAFAEVSMVCLCLLPSDSFACVVMLVSVLATSSRPGTACLLSSS